ncbi:MAG: rhodanese-like domain-containing protein [Rhodobacteraceae bacterium]|nr:rhodanese-like domain-containing protein [Paracoccaceae bacterium]
MTDAPRKFTTRRALLGGAGVLFLGGAYLFGVRWRYYGDHLDAVQAHRAATRGDILLVDIRTPEEWRATGVGVGARMLDMRRPDFVEMLDGMAEGDRGRPVALICARGVRSARLSKALTSAGFTRIIDVPEGMIGSFAGPGWLKRGLPVTPV